MSPLKPHWMQTWSRTLLKPCSNPSKPCPNPKPVFFADLEPRYLESPALLSMEMGEKTWTREFRQGCVAFMSASCLISSYIYYFGTPSFLDGFVSLEVRKPETVEVWIWDCDCSLSLVEIGQDGRTEWFPPRVFLSPDVRLSSWNRW